MCSRRGVERVGRRVRDCWGEVSETVERLRLRLDGLRSFGGKKEFLIYFWIGRREEKA